MKKLFSNMQIETEKLYNIIEEEVNKLLAEDSPYGAPPKRRVYKEPRGHMKCPEGLKYRDYGTAGQKGCWKYDSDLEDSYAGEETPGWELVLKHDEKGKLRHLTPDEGAWFAPGHGADYHRPGWRPHGKVRKSDDGHERTPKLKRPLITVPMKPGPIYDDDGHVVAYLRVDPAVLKAKKHYVTLAKREFLMGMYRRVGGVHNLEDTGKQSGGHISGHATHRVGSDSDIPIPIVYTDPNGKKVHGYNFVAHSCVAGDCVYPGQPRFKGAMTKNMKMLSPYEKKRGQWRLNKRLEDIGGDVDWGRMHQMLVYMAEQNTDRVILGPALVKGAEEYSKKLIAQRKKEGKDTTSDNEIHKRLFVGGGRIVSIDNGKKLSGDDRSQRWHDNHFHVRFRPRTDPHDLDATVDYEHSTGRLVPTKKTNPFGKAIDLGETVFHKDPMDPKTIDPGATEFYSSEEELDKEYPEFAKPPKYEKPKLWDPKDRDLNESKKIKVSNLANIIREELQNYLMGDNTVEELHQLFMD